MTYKNPLADFIKQSDLTYRTVHSKKKKKAVRTIRVPAVLLFPCRPLRDAAMLSMSQMISEQAMAKRRAGNYNKFTQGRRSNT